MMLVIQPGPQAKSYIPNTRPLNFLGPYGLVGKSGPQAILSALGFRLPAFGYRAKALWLSSKTAERP